MLLDMTDCRWHRHSSRVNSIYLCALAVVQPIGKSMRRATAANAPSHGTAGMATTRGLHSSSARTDMPHITCFCLDTRATAGRFREHVSCAEQDAKESCWLAGSTMCVDDSSQQ